ncbi:hypothetical protein GCM10027048_45660 [Hymenobacter coalescens]
MERNNEDNHYIRQQQELRAQAEKRRSLVAAATADKSPEEVQRLVQELQVYQIELEMQYEELLQAQAETDALRQQYVDLYDFAPVGYCSLGAEGLIHQLNLSAARLLGAERGALVGRRLALFVALPDRDAFHAFLQRVFRYDEPQRCELTLQRADGSEYHVLLEGSRQQGAQGTPLCRLALVDESERHRAVEALAASERKFRTLFEQSKDAAVLLDHGRFADCNRAAVEILGAHGPEQIVGQRLTLLAPEVQPDGHQSELLAARVTALLHQTGSYRYEWLMHRFTGEEIWLEIVLTAIGPPDEQLAYGVWRDVTDRKRAAAALAASEARFRTVFEQSADGMLLLQDGRYVGCNRAALALIGAEREAQLLGQPAWVRTPELQPNGRHTAEWFRANVEQAVREGSVRCEVLMHHFSGADIWVEAVLTPISLPGQPMLTHVCWRNVTERRRNEQRLQESEQRLTTAIEAADMGIGLWDFTTQMFGVDERSRRMFGLPAEGSDLSFTELMALVHPADVALATDALQQAAAGHRPLDVEVRVVHPDGEVRHVVANGRVMQDETGAAVRMSGVLRDVTERHLAQQRLRESEEQLRTALAAADMGVGLWEPYAREVVLDARTAEIFGLAGPGRYPAATLSAQLHPDDRALFAQHAQLSVQRREPFTLIGRVLAPADGPVRYVRISGQALYDDHGQPSRVAGVVRDITRFRQAQQRLHDSEERLRLALQSSDTGVWEWSFADDELFWDERAQAIFGRPYEDRRLTFDAIDHAVHAADQAGVAAALRASISGGQPFELEHRIVWADGTVRYVAASGQVHYDEAGQPRRLTGLVRDVTERHEAQEELSYKNRLLDHILNTIPAVLTRIGPEGTLLEAKGAGLRRLGVAEDALRGRNVFDAWPVLTTHIRRLLAGEEVQFVGEPPARGGEQTYFQNYGFFDEERQTGVLFGIDVTATHQANARLAADAAFLQGLVSNIQEGIMTFDTELRVTEWNYLMEQYLLVERSAILGRSVFEALPAIDNAWHRDLLTRTLAGEAQTYYNVPFTLRAGQFDAAFVPLRDAAGAVTGALGVIRDVTERNRLMEEATQLRLQREKEVLSAILHTQEDERKRIAEALHNGVGQLLYAAKLHLYTQPVEESHRSAALGLLNEAIKATRTISFELTPNILEDFGLKTALEELCKRIPKQNLDVHLHVTEPEPPLPRLFETAVYRIVQELLNNVIKHAQAREAFVYVEPQGKSLHVSVEDDGVGFDVEAATTKRKGIGLAGIRNRVSLLGGQLTLRSMPGLGTTISIELPVAQEEAPKP